MADSPGGYSATRMVLVIVASLAVLAVAAWQLGLFADDTDEGMRPAYEAGVTDEGGGELIVTDTEAPAVEDVDLPETPMTPVPPGEEAGAAPTAAEEVE
jgi:hypothetical protein